MLKAFWGTNTANVFKWKERGGQCSQPLVTPGVTEPVFQLSP